MGILMKHPRCVLRRQINEHKDSIESFKKGARGDLVAKEEAELKILRAYMPPELSEAEIEVMVKSAIEEAGSVSKKDMGKIMKIIMEKTQGKADGKTVSQVVGRYLK